MQKGYNKSAKQTIILNMFGIMGFFKQWFLTLNRLMLCLYSTCIIINKFGKLINIDEIFNIFSDNEDFDIVLKAP